MGLIKAALGSVAGVLGDQWREYFYCESMPDHVLVSKGSKRTGNRSSNRSGSDNVISNGAVIAVNEGQCMMIVEQGQIVEFAAEPGEFTWNASTESTIFYGGFGEGIKGSWENLKRRFTFGADTAKDQRVYFFNLKEIVGNKFGTPSPVPFRVVDKNIGLDVDISIRCNGEYSYKISDPMLFYKNVCGNVTNDYTRDRLDSQLKSEFLTALQPAFAKISASGIRYSALPAHAMELAEAMDDALTAKWSGLRGISVVSVGINSAVASAEDEAMIKNLQRSAVYRNPNMAGAALVDAQAEAMKSAAQNENGAMMGFMGMNMAAQAGGVNAGDLYRMAPQVPAQDEENTWKCPCGATNDGKFCTECGAARPSGGWRCPGCGKENNGKFCPECGTPRPTPKSCSRCGWTSADPNADAKFCPECGNKL